jgi:hypothetical protein
MPKLTVLKSRDGWVAKLVKVTWLSIVLPWSQFVSTDYSSTLTRVGLAMHVQL